MVPGTEIKVSESGTILEIGNIDFQVRDNEYCYLFIYLFIFEILEIQFMIHYKESEAAIHKC